MVISFGLIRLAPGDPVLARLGAEAAPEAIDRLRRALRLDVDPVTQFLEYFWSLLHGNLGKSIENGRDVMEIIATSLPVTLWIIARDGGHGPRYGGASRALRGDDPASAGAVCLPRRDLGVPGGSGLLHGADRPDRLRPPLRYRPDPRLRAGLPANLRYLWLPALVICTTLVPVLARVLHSSIVETMGEEFVETGIIRGVDRSRFYWFYLLKPSLAPTIVLLSYMVGVMIGSTVIIETIFSLPGIGRNLVGAVIGRDYPVVQGIVLVFGLMVVAIGLVGDVIANWLDPRVGIS